MDHVVLRCVGIGPGEELTAADLDELAEVAEKVHAGARWSEPFRPDDLAQHERVGLYPAHEQALFLDRAFFVSCPDQREEGLRMAHALAGVLLLRRRSYSDLRAWALAADLLVPEWSIDAGHLWAPAWLLKLRRRVLRAA